jgi:hypothetical protein
MKVVYHGVPRDFVGDVIYPLNQLAVVDRRLYEFQVSKYAGREAALDFLIPGLGVKFNDAVHCACLHPYYLFAARQTLGLNPQPRPAPPSWATGLAFEIPLERILVHPVVWYSCRSLWVNGAPNEDVPLVPPSDEFEPFDSVRYQPLTAPTEAHVAYLRRMRDRGERSLMFVHIPHILVAGPIDVSGLRIVRWDEPPGTPSRDARSQQLIRAQAPTPARQRS